MWASDKTSLPVLPSYITTKTHVLKTSLLFSFVVNNEIRFSQYPSNQVFDIFTVYNRHMCCDIIVIEIDGQKAL